MSNKNEWLATSKQIMGRMNEIEDHMKVHWGGMVIGSMGVAAPAADPDIRWAVEELFTKDYCADIGNTLQQVGCNLDLFMFSIEHMDKMWLMGIGVVGVLGLLISSVSMFKLKYEHTLLDMRRTRHDFID